MAAQRRLQTGHQQRGENAFAADVRKRDAHGVRARANEVVVVAADHARGAADGGEFQAGERRQHLREELRLHFAGDDDFVLQLLALALLFDQLGDGAGHLVERFAERAKLVALVHAHALGEIAAADVQRGFVQIVHGTGDGAREDEARGEPCNSQQQEDHCGGDQQYFQHRADVADGSEQPAAERGGADPERSEHGGGRVGRLRTHVRELDGRNAVDAHVSPILRSAQSAAAAGDLLAGNEDVAVEIERNALRIGIAARPQRDYSNGAELGREAVEERGV